MCLNNTQKMPGPFEFEGIKPSLRDGADLQRKIQLLGNVMSFVVINLALYSEMLIVSRIS